MGAKQEGYDTGSFILLQETCGVVFWGFLGTRYFIFMENFDVLFKQNTALKTWI